MRQTSPRLLRALAACAVVAVLAFSAVAVCADPATEGSVEGAMLQLKVQAGDQVREHAWGIDWQPNPGNGRKYDWILPGPVAEYNGDELLYSIDSLTVSIDTDPQVTLNFAVSAGNTPTVFTINSATVLFPTIVNPYAAAGASISITDATGDGAVRTGLKAGNMSYSADTDLGNYALLVGNDAVGPFGSNSVSGNQTTQIIGSVSSISSSFEFQLSAFDLASGTSTFVVQADPIPEPASLLALGSGLVGMAGLMMRRRTR